MKKLLKIEVNKKWCKSCGICIGMCTRNVLASDENGSPAVINADNCILCRLCEYRCPDFAIKVVEEQ